jgi:L-amino acid N-acyltransferase YncA
MSIADIDLRIRPAVAADAGPLCAILNQIIAIGGTTAFETPLSLADFDAEFLSGSNYVCCLMAETAGGEALGFQSLVRKAGLADGWADIATFTRREPRTPGVGVALFEATKTAARALGLIAINATIRADNYAGIPYYEKIGFETYAVAEAVPLKDGTPVDRVSKVYRLSLKSAHPREGGDPS